MALSSRLDDIIKGAVKNGPSKKMSARTRNKMMKEGTEATSKNAPKIMNNIDSETSRIMNAIDNEIVPPKYSNRDVGIPNAEAGILSKDFREIRGKRNSENLKFENNSFKNIDTESINRSNSAFNDISDKKLEKMQNKSNKAYEKLSKNSSAKPLKKELTAKDKINQEQLKEKIIKDRTANGKNLSKTPEESKYFNQKNIKTAVGVGVSGAIVLNMFNKGGQMSNSELYGQQQKY